LLAGKRLVSGKMIVPEDFEDFVNFGVSREERLASTHLSEDAAD
jgi:hypothetical protein